MQVLTKDAVLDETADALGYIEESSVAAAAQDRCTRRLAALDRLPDGFTVARGGVYDDDDGADDPKLIGEKYGLYVPGLDTIPLVVVEREGCKLTLRNGITTETVRAARALTVAIELAAIDCEGREEK